MDTVVYDIGRLTKAGIKAEQLAEVVTRTIIRSPWMGTDGVSGRTVTFPGF